jgi:hypothetical protein
VVDPKEISAMAALNAALANVESGGPATLPRSQVKMRAPDAGPEPYTPPSPDTAAMKNVLSKFYKSLGDAMAESVVQPELSQAMETRRIPQGLQVRKYKILVNETQLPNGGIKKRYSVQHQNGDILAEDLQVGAAALQLVHYLNAGKKINDRNIIKILQLEEKYVSFRNEAIRYKQLYRAADKMGKTSKRDIYEAKYQHARNIAIETKNELEKFSNTVD